MKIFVTGANGFLGQAVCRRLLKDGYEVSGGVHKDCRLQEGIKKYIIGDIGADTNFKAILREHEVVIHLAGRVHIMRDISNNPMEEYRRVNVDGSCNLAQQAAISGVKRFIFISSVKVNGEQTAPGRPFTEMDTPAPIDPYGISKFEAEQGLRSIASKTGMEIVIIRPPLVYGPGVKANFLSMMQWLHKGVPLPLGAIHNKRSLVALDNLVDFIVLCMKHPAAANQIFFVSDGEDISTTELLKRMAVALGVPARLVPVPTWLLKAGAAAVGKGSVARRLLASLQVDITKAKQLLGWSPPVTMDEGLKKTANWFLESKQC